VPTIAAPSTDFHNCAIASANSRSRQLVTHPGRAETDGGAEDPRWGTLCLTPVPLHSRGRNLSAHTSELSGPNTAKDKSTVVARPDGTRGEARFCRSRDLPCDRYGRPHPIGTDDALRARPQRSRGPDACA
jgi:hypothetical protein